MTEHAQSLVGRDRELETLARLLGEAKEGSPRFAQVTGEPGIGKTFLLNELGRRADTDGWLVLRGRSSELESELPFGLVVDAFDAYLASLDPRAFERIALDELTELAGLFPSLRSLVPEPEDPVTPGERFRAHRAVVEMIERLAAQQPVLLLLDDLHWADGASVEQAGYVLRRPPQAAVMIVGSFRTGQADPALAAAVTDGARAGLVELLELGPLERGDATQLVGDSSLSDRIYEHSGGNPFYLLQLARADGVDATAGDVSQQVPATVAATISSELDGLSSEARGLAEAAAVAGDPFELDLAATVGDLEEPTALSAVDELVARDLIRPTPVPRTFQFRHPLVRSAVHDGIAPGARLGAHQRASRALAAQGAPAIERAHHVEYAARRGDSDAVAVLREAGQAATGRAPSSAARWFETGLRLLGDDASDDDRLGLLMALAGAQAAIGRLEDARSSLLEAMTLEPSHGGVPKERLIVACAAIEQLVGREREALERLQRGLAEIEDKSSPDAAAFMLDLAINAFYRADFDEMLEWGQSALAVAAGAGQQPLLAATHAVIAFAASCVGPVPLAQEHCDQATTITGSLSDDELATRLDATAWLVASEFYLDRYETGFEHAQRGLAIARSTGQGELIPALVQAIANIMFQGGRPAEAGVLLDEAIDAARLTDNATALAWSLLNRGYSALLGGDIETARATGTEAFELTEHVEHGAVATWAGATYGLTLIEDGRTEEGIEAMVSRGGGPDGSLIAGAWRTAWLEGLSKAQLDLGRLDEAKQSAALARKRADEFPLPFALTAAGAAEARVALSEGSAAEAGRMASAAAEHTLASGALLASAQSRALAGQAFAEAGDSDAAIAELERARELFERTGATRYRDSTELALGKLGRRSHRRSRPGEGEGVGSLTGRELEVAQLVVDRRTNPEIAAELFLSVKTVETHMRNIFRKLDVSSRVEVARMLESARAR